MSETSDLQRNFGRRDVLYLLVCALVGVDGLGALATRGGAAFTWMIGSVLLFAVPSAPKNCAPPRDRAYPGRAEERPGRRAVRRREAEEGQWVV